MYASPCFYMYICLYPNIDRIMQDIRAGEICRTMKVIDLHKARLNAFRDHADEVLSLKVYHATPAAETRALMEISLLNVSLRLMDG